ncbi:MAG: N-acetylmuramoyl-L-alanine amidase [Candidatus Bathyarchaeia archaeon]
MRVVFLKGDYTGKDKTRQLQAKLKGVNFVVSFHFNSASNPKAQGAEVYYNIHASKDIADALMDAIVGVLNNPRRIVREATNTRASFINHYHCPAVLIEPCFISNKHEAEMIHDVETLRKLGESIAQTLRRFLPKEATVGLDIGHKFKEMSPYDKGAKCVLGDWEADHNERLAKVVAASLKAMK